jgi:hypothetical protein
MIVLSDNIPHSSRDKSQREPNPMGTVGKWLSLVRFFYDCSLCYRMCAGMSCRHVQSIVHLRHQLFHVPTVRLTQMFVLSDNCIQTCSHLEEAISSGIL